MLLFFVEMVWVVARFGQLYSLSVNSLLHFKSVFSRSRRPQRTSSSFASRTPSRTPCSPACLPATTRSDRRKSAPSYSADGPGDRCEYEHKLYQLKVFNGRSQELILWQPGVLLLVLVQAKLPLSCFKESTLFLQRILYVYNLASFLF